MSRVSGKLGAALSAGLLAIVTLTTFYLVRNYGPESAIQRFHTYALAGDQNGIAQLIVQPSDNQRLLMLEATVMAMARAGAHPELVSVQRGPREIIAHIAYRGNGPGIDIYWVVDQTNASRWLINPDRSLVTRPEWGS